MFNVTKLLGVSAELELDPTRPKGKLRAKAVLELDGGGKTSLEEEFGYEDDAPRSGNGRPPTFQELTEVSRFLSEMLIEHPYFKLALCESPIELTFFFNAMYEIRDLRPQVEVGPYRVDLAIPEKKVAIELDGHEFHKTRTQRTDDAARQRYLQREGWQVIRFTGTEINRDVNQCILEAIEIIDQLPSAD